MKPPDINCDLGEQESPEIRAALMKWIDSANIACGGHAGTISTIKHSITLAMEHDVHIGAHPGICADGGRGLTFPTPTELVDLLDQQIPPFLQMTNDCGGKLHHIKLHGTLYHATDQIPELAEVFLDWCNRHLTGVRIYARSGGGTAHLAQKKQIPCWDECFLDRAYESDGRLRERRLADAMIDDIAALEMRLNRWHSSRVMESHDGVILPLSCRTFCIHSDGPNALRFAEFTRCFFSQFPL